MALALVAAVVILQRWRYTGLWNFDRNFRVVGPFASMHVGGGHLGAFLVMALPAALVLMLRAPRLWLRVVTGVVVAAAVYALLVSFARSVWAGSALGITVTMLLLLRRSAPRSNGMPRGAVFGLTVGLVVAFASLLFDFAGGSSPASASAPYRRTCGDGLRSLKRPWR